MSGIEIVGLALGIFPLLIVGVEFYANSTRAIKDMWRDEKALKALLRDLNTERSKFVNTCESLLEVIVSGSELVQLMEDPGGPLWKDDIIQEKLKNRLRAGAVECYMVNMGDLFSELTTLKGELGLHQDDIPGSANRKAFKKQLRKIRLYTSKPEYKERLDRITKINATLATLTGQSRSASSLPPTTTTPIEDYKRIRDHAIGLYEVLKERLQTTSGCGCIAPHYAGLSLEVPATTTARKPQSQAIGLRFHIAISSAKYPTDQGPPLRNWQEIGIEPLDKDKERWGSMQAKGVNRDDCLDMERGCVDTRPSPMPTTEKESSMRGFATRLTSKVRFIFSGEDGESSHIARPVTPVSLYSRDSKYQNRLPKDPRVSFSPRVSFTDLTPITPDDLPGGTMKNIENLCLSIHQSKKGLPSFGVIIDGKSRKYRVCPPRQLSFPPKSTHVLSLEDLLAQPRTLKRKDRLILGVQLASAVMQLHKTEWLSEKWGTKDIHFCQETAKDARDTRPITRKPFVYRTFAPPIGSLSENIHEPTKQLLILQDQSLFSLGITLLELHYGQCLGKLRIEADFQTQTGQSESSGMATVTDMTDYMTARRLSGEVYDEAGQQYGDAVRRCINGLDHRDPDLRVDDFKKEVQMKVVSPLVESLESFCGMKIGEILQKECPESI